MKILLFLLSFFISEYKGGILMPIFEDFKKNNFDIKKTLYSLTPEMVTPVIAKILGIEQNENPPSNGGSNGLDAIINIADITIFSCLYDYFNKKT